MRKKAGKVLLKSISLCIVISLLTAATVGYAAAPTATSATITNSTSSTVDIMITGTDFVKFCGSGTGVANATDLLKISYDSQNPTASVIEDVYTIKATFPITIGTDKSGGDLTIAAGTVQDAVYSNNPITIADGSIMDSASPVVTNVSSAADNKSYKAGETIAVTVTFSEIVNVTGAPTLTLETGAMDRDVAYTGGSGTNTLTFNYTVQPGDTSSDLDYTATTALALSGGTIRDAALNNATLTLPLPGAAGSLGWNKAIVIDTTAPAAPTIASVAGKTPSPATSNDPTPDVEISGLTAGDTVKIYDTDGITVLGTGVATGATITITLGALSEGVHTLTATATDPAGNEGLALGAFLYTYDGTAPTVTSISSSIGNGSYRVGQVIDITIKFSEDVDVNTLGGTPKVTLETGDTDRDAIYAGKSAPDTLTFSYTVQAGDTSLDLDYVDANSLTLNGGTIKDAASNGANLTLPAPGAAGSLGANKAIVIDTTAPTVTGVSSNSADGTYGLGQTITVKVVFDEVVNVTGSPVITLETGEPDRGAIYTGGSGTNTLTFDYTIQAGDASADLDYVDTNSLSGTIKDTAGNDAILTLAIPGTAGSLGANANIVIDTTAPVVTNVSSTKVNGSYKVGEIIAVTVTFSEIVNVTGTPLLTLETGDTDRDATYTGGSGTNALTFSYTVQAGDTSSDLDYKATTSLSLNGGTIKSASLNNAVLILPEPGTEGSLGYNKAIVIDTTAPTVTLTKDHADLVVRDADSVEITATFSEAMSVAPTISIDAVGIDADINTAMTGAGTTWTYIWDVPAGHDGSATVTVAGSDVAGNAYAGIDNITFTIDNIAPTVTLTEDHADLIVRDADSVEITATFSEAMSVAPTISINAVGDDADINAAMTGAGTTWTYIWNVLAGHDGSATVTVAGSDVAGNAYAGADSITFTIDNIAPTVTLTKDHADLVVRDADNVEITATFNEAMSVAPTISINAVGADADINTAMTGAGTTWTYIWNVPAGHDGSAAVTVAGNDIAGNAYTGGSGFTFTVDNTLPILSAVSIASNNTSSDMAKVGDAVTLSITSSETIQTPSVNLAGHAVVPAGSGASWTAVYNMVYEDTEGIILFNIGFTDVAGNAGAAVTAVTDGSSVTYDKTPPAASNAPTAAAGPAIDAVEEANGFDIVVGLGASGAIAGDRIELLLNSGTFPSPITQVLAPSDIAAGNCTFTIVQGQLGADGTKAIASRITDKAGNIGAISAALNLTLDATASINPTMANFDKNPVAQADVAVTMTLKGNTLSALKKDTVTLTLNTDYTVSGNTVTIKKEYLSTLSTGAHTLTFDLDVGNDPAITVAVTNSAPPPAGGSGGGDMPSSVSPTTPSQAKLEISNIAARVSVSSQQVEQAAKAVATIVDALTGSKMTDHQKAVGIDVAASVVANLATIIGKTSDTKAAETIIAKVCEMLEAMPATAAAIKEEKSMAESAVSISAALEKSAALLSAVKDSSLRGTIAEKISGLYDTIASLGMKVTAEDKAVEIMQGAAKALSALDDILKALNDESARQTLTEKAAGTFAAAGRVIELLTTPEKAMKAAKDIIRNTAGIIESDINEASVEDIGKGVAGVAEKAIGKLNREAITQPLLVGQTAKAVVTNAIADKILKKAESVTAAVGELEAEMDAGKIEEEIKTRMVVEVSKPEGTNTIETTLPVTLMDSLKSKGIGKLEINAGIASIIIEAGAVNGEGSDTVSFTVKETDREKDLTPEQRSAVGDSPVYDFNASVAGRDGSEKKVDSFGKPVEIAIPYVLKAGEDAEKLTVFLLNDKGELEDKCGRYDPATGTVRFTVKHFSKYIVRQNDVSFKDSEDVTWAERYIEVMAAKGIVKGMSADRFEPGLPVKRAEFAALLVRMFGLEDKAAECSFKDVKPENWYYATVASAVKAGLVKGYDDGTFRPEEKISRQDMVTMAARAAQMYKELKAPADTGKYLDFVDNAQLRDYAKEPAALAVKYGIMGGRPGKVFDPLNSATRAEAVKVIYLIYNK